MRRRGEYLERSFAHVYDTGAMRRTHLRGHRNILKRLLVHASAFNLGILMRAMFGRGTPRGLQGRVPDPRALQIVLTMFIARLSGITSALLAPLPLPSRHLGAHSACAFS
jgi:transposase